MKRDALKLAILAVLFIGCGETVARLDLRDPRLPVEARRWLADTEDEVAIARAMCDDLEAELKQLNEYQERLTENIEDDWPEDRSTGDEGKQASSAFKAYAKERVVFKKLELEEARAVLELAKARLMQARAETAVRYDIAVYELEPIIEEVESLKGKVADSTKRLEEQRIIVEESAGKAWMHYHIFAGKGGQTNALWTTH